MKLFPIQMKVYCYKTKPNLTNLTLFGTPLPFPNPPGSLGPYPNPAGPLGELSTLIIRINFDEFQI